MLTKFWRGNRRDIVHMGSPDRNGSVALRLNLERKLKIRSSEVDETGSRSHIIAGSTISEADLTGSATIATKMIINLFNEHS
jgi:hypothetical protein